MITAMYFSTYKLIMTAYYPDPVGNSSSLCEKLMLANIRISHSYRVM